MLNTCFVGEIRCHFPFLFHSLDLVKQCGGSPSFSQLCWSLTIRRDGKESLQHTGATTQENKHKQTKEQGYIPVNFVLTRKKGPMSEARNLQVPEQWVSLLSWEGMGRQHMGGPQSAPQNAQFHSLIVSPTALAARQWRCRFPVLQTAHKWNTWTLLSHPSSSSLPMPGMEVATSGTSSPESSPIKAHFFDTSLMHLSLKCFFQKQHLTEWSQQCVHGANYSNNQELHEYFQMWDLLTPLTNIPIIAD